MKKLIKLGISLFSVAILGATTQVLIDSPIFGYTVVRAEEQQGQINFRVRHLLEGSNEEVAPMETGVLNPGESINIRKDLEGYQAVSNYSWMPDYNLTYDIVRTYFYGAPDGYMEGYIEYRKLNPANPTPAPTPDPGQGQNQNPTPAPTPDPAKDQKDPAKPDKPQLPETGEKDSAGITLVGLLTATLAWFVLRKKS